MSLLVILLSAAQPAALVADGATAPVVAEASADAATAPEAQLSEAVAPAPMPAQAAAIAGVTIPKLTPIAVEVLDPLGSKLSKTGDMFPIRLAAPIVIDGVEVLAAGTPGMGEVIFAKKAGGMGAAGELVVTARYLEVDGRQLPLRSMRLGQTGESKINTVNTINVASAAAFPALSLIGYFIGGGQVNVAAGTVAEAKTAQDFSLPVVPAAEGAPSAPAADESAAPPAAEPAAVEPAPPADTTLSMGPDHTEGNGE